MWLKKLLKKIRVRKNYNQFKKASIFGERLGLDFTSKCISKNRNNIKIGKRCEIKGTLVSSESGKISIGDNLYMGYNTFIGAVDSITIADNVIIASNVRIFDNNNHPVEPEKRLEMSKNDFYGDLWQWKKASHKPVIINDNVWIGEYSTILKGVTIGRGSIVASHAVVTKDVPEYVIVAGNPARVVKKLKNIEDKV